MSVGYRYTVDEDGCELLHRLPKRQRERLLEVLRNLAAHPITRGDYQSADARGLPLEVALCAESFVVTWQVDHAVKQVRGVELEKI